MHTRGMAVAVVASLLVATGARADRPTVLPLMMPTRNGEAPAVRARIARIAAQVATKLSGDLTAATPPLKLAARFSLGRAAAISGDLDQAANLLDAALTEGVRAPDCIDDAAGFIGAHVRRASISIARGEASLARMLLSRLYRYDPTLALSPLESTPQLSATFDDVRKQSGATPALTQEDLGDTCHHAVIVLAARMLAAGAFQLERFDNCQPTAHTIVNVRDADETVAASLSQPLVVAAVVSSPLPSLAKKNPHMKLIAGAILLGAGIALVAAGGYYAARAVSDANGINANCSTTTPCSGAELRSRDDSYRSATTAASVLVPVGAAALATGAVLTIFGVRQTHAAFAFVPGGATVGLTWTY